MIAIDYPLTESAVRKRDETGHQRYFVILVEALPQLPGEIVYIRKGQLYGNRLTLKTGQRFAVAQICMEKMSAAGHRLIIKELPQASGLAGIETFDDAEFGELNGVSYNISTLRLMEDKDCRLILMKKDTGETIFNISFPEYIGMIGALYTNLGRQLTVQEYLDRQDFYTIVFFLSSDLNQLIQLQVNSWRLRAKNHLKL